MKPKLIFFDINGTLIARDARTDLPYTAAINQLLKVDNAMAGVNTSARSDEDVFYEVLRNHNTVYSKALWEDFLRLYQEALVKWQHTDVWRPNVDATPFVEALSKTPHKLSLITGELSMGAEFKLKKIGLWQYFPTGGFGEHGLKRFDIASYALKEARHYYGLPESGDQAPDLYVIGDTLLDIKTARHLQATAIAIATGSNTKEELAAENPDYLIDTFDQLKALFL